MPSLPHNTDPGSVGILANSYNSLGHCLRSNIFPGCPVAWKSVTSESYMAHPLTAWPPDHWFGHKTDDMGSYGITLSFCFRCVTELLALCCGFHAVQWTEINIMNHKLKKTMCG